MTSIVPRQQRRSRLLRAGLYARSQIDPAAPTAAEQSAGCRRLAEQVGWRVAEVYVDDERGHREWHRLLADVRAGEIEAVCAWHVSTLTTLPADLGTFLDACEQHDVQVATVCGEVDLGTDAGRRYARQLAAAAASDDERQATTRRRTSAGHGRAGQSREEEA